MKSIQLVIAALLLLSTMAAPPAAADHVPCDYEHELVANACNTSMVVVHNVEDFAYCLLTVGIIYWGDCINDII